MIPLTGLTLTGRPSWRPTWSASRGVVFAVSLAAVFAAAPLAAQEAADPLHEGGIDRPSGPAGEHGSERLAPMTETDIIRSLAPFADGNPVARPRAPRGVDSDRGRVRVDYGHAIDITVFFEYDSARLTPEAGAQLAPLGRALQSRQLLPYRFLVAGHTDASGDPAYNRSLSLRRAAAVRGYLAQTYGVDPLRLVIHGWGQSRLKDRVNPFSGINRRVEIALIANPSVGEAFEGYDPGAFAEIGRRGRIVEAPGAAWYDVDCGGAPAVGTGGHFLSDPRWWMSRYALDDFGALPTVPCTVDADGPPPPAAVPSPPAGRSLSLRPLD